MEMKMNAHMPCIYMYIGTVAEECQKTLATEKKA